MKTDGIKAKYPEGLGPGSAEGVFAGPRDRAPEELRWIIEECRQWPTDEAAELADEAEEILLEATGQAADNLISDSLAADGAEVVFEWASGWLCDDLLDRAIRVHLEAGGRLKLWGYQDGWPWRVELVHIPDSVQAAVRNWVPSKKELTEEYKFTKWARRYVEELIADNKRSGEIMRVRVATPREREVLADALARLAEQFMEIKEGDYYEGGGKDGQPWRVILERDV